MTNAMARGDRILLWVGSIGPLGHLPASGTMTVALIGLPLYYLMHRWSDVVAIGFTVGVTAAAVALHHAGDRILRQKDSRTLVWDEVAGFLWAVALVPFTWRLALLAVVVERTLDIVKVPPASWIERQVPGGWGVVGDDVVAGLYTCGLLHFVAYAAPGAAGLSA